MSSVHGSSGMVESGCTCHVCAKTRVLVGDHNYDGVPFMLPTFKLNDYALLNRCEPFGEQLRAAWRHMLQKEWIDDAEADWWAVKGLGVHPVLVWPEWYDLCLELGEWDGDRQEVMFS